ncbi:MAG TPA: glycosyltransferase 87 family protein [Myxococcaceae bacterium]|nr:glycosyltransferase 87 family protein [Myxococcaceae bacterium]
MSHAETGARQEGNAPQHLAGTIPRSAPASLSDGWWHAAAVLLLFGLVAHAWLLKAGSDFEVFRLAGWRTWHGVGPYQAADGLMPFKYAPPVALLLVPLAWVPERTAYLVWLVLSALAVLRVVRWSHRTLGPGPDARREALLMVALFPLIAHQFALGQCDAFLLLLVAESEQRRRTAPLRSGMLWALACLVKPPFLLVGLLVAWRREARRADGLLLGIAAAFGVLGFALGPVEALHQTQAWVGLLGATTPAGLCGPQNQSIAALVCTYGGVAPGSVAFAATAALLATALVAAAVACVRVVARHHLLGADALALALVLHGTALLSPLGWRTTLLALIPSLTLIFARDVGASDPVRVRMRRLCGWALAFTAVVLNWDVLGERAFHALLRMRIHALLGLVISTCAMVVTARRTGLWRAPAVSAGVSPPPPRSARPLRPGFPARSWAFLVAAMLLALGTVWVRPGPAILRGTDAACYARLAEGLAGLPAAQWASPRLDGARFDEHPPLGFWLEAAWMRAVGPGPASAWRWAQLLATLLVAVVGLGACRIGGPTSGGLALVGLCSLPGFLSESQNPMLETPLAFGLAVAAVGAGLLRETPRTGSLLFVAGTAFAAWVKGPPALATFAVLAWVAWRQRLPSRWAAVTALSALAVVAAGFGVLELWRAGAGEPAFLPRYVHDQLLASALHGRGRPVHDPLYFLSVLGRWYLPVLLVAPLALWPGWWRRAADGDRRLLALGAVLLVTVVVGFSVPVQKNPWYVHAAMAGCAWVLGALGAGLLGERLVRWLRPERVLVAAALAVAWVFFPVPKHGDQDALYWLYAGERPAFTADAPRVVANCSPLGAWMADQSFSLVWGARSVPCSASAELEFDGREVRRAR